MRAEDHYIDLAKYFQIFLWMAQNSGKSQLLPRLCIDVANSNLSTEDNWMYMTSLYPNN